MSSMTTNYTQTKTNSIIIRENLYYNINAKTQFKPIDFPKTLVVVQDRWFSIVDSERTRICIHPEPLNRYLYFTFEVYPTSAYLLN